MYLTHFGVKFTRINFNTVLHFTHPFTLNFIGTSLFHFHFKMSCEFKNEFYRKVNIGLWKAVCENEIPGDLFIYF